jgi:hypothetical protein
MASYIKFNSFVEAVAEKVHNLGSDQLKVALTNTDPTAAATNYASLTSPLPNTNLAGATPFNITRTSSSQTSGTYSLVLQDLTLTASGGDVGPFRYVVIYNDTATNDELIGYYDYGTSTSITNGNTFTIDFTQSQTLLELV